MICINTKSHLSEYHKIKMNKVKNWFIKKFNLPSTDIHYLSKKLDLPQSGYYYEKNYIELDQFNKLSKIHPLYKYSNKNLSLHLIINLLHELVHHLQYIKYNKWFRRYLDNYWDAKKPSDYYNIRTEYIANKISILIFEKYLPKHLTN